MHTIDQLTKTIESLKHEQTLLEKELEVKVQLGRSLQQKLQAKSAELEQIKAKEKKRVSDKDAKHVSLEQANGALKKRVKALDAKGARQTKTIKVLKEAQLTLKQRETTMTTKHDETIRELTQKIESLQQQQTQLEKDELKQKERESDMDAKHKSLEQANGALRKKMKALA